jgi:hypothetical protein
MKRLLASILAAAVALTALAGAADAKPKYWKKNWNKHHPHMVYHAPRPHFGYYYPRPYYYDPGPAIVAGTIFGVIGALAANGGGYAYRGPASHTAWCEWRYKTYNPATNTYFARPGVPAVCHSPYR